MNANLNTQKVSFKSYQNVLQGHYAKYMSEDKLSVGFRIVAQATGEDLEHWASSLKKFPDSDNFVKVDAIFDDCVDGDNGRIGIRQNAKVHYFLNNQKVPICNENMPVFTQIIKFLNTISSTVETAKSTEVSPFRHTDEYQKGIERLDDNLTIEPETISNAELEDLQNPKKIRDKAIIIKNSITTDLNKFFED